MDAAAAKKFLVEARDEQTSYAVAKLAALTPGVIYSPQRLYNRLEERLEDRGVDQAKAKRLAIFIMAFADGAIKLGSEGAAGKIFIGGHSSSGVPTGDWEIDFERTGVEITPDEQTLEAIEVLTTQEPEVLRKTLSRLIDTTEMTFVLPVEEMRNFTIEDSATIGAGSLKDVITVGESVKLAGFLMRPGGGTGDIVQIRVERVEVEPEKDTPTLH